MAELQARHATALRSYALELWDGDAARADSSLSALWREWRQTPPRTDDASAREAAFAALRRQIVAAQRRAGARAEPEHESDTGETGREAATERVARRFRQLTPKQQEVLRLRLRHGFGADEIAHITELASAAVEQLIHHALGRLDGSHGDEPRLTHLALGSATVEETAHESPADRARIAQLRLTAEVARQVLARGGETFVAKKRQRSRRRFFVVAGVAVLAAAGIVFFLLRNRAPDRATAATAGADLAASGAKRVAIARMETEKNSASGASPTDNGGSVSMPRRAAHEASAHSQNSASGRNASPPTPASLTAGNDPARASEPPPRSNVDSPARTEISTGEVGRAEPNAQPRATTDREKIGGPTAQPLGRTEPPSATPPPAPAAPAQTPYRGVSPASTVAPPTPAETDARGFPPRRLGGEPPAATERSTSGHKAPSTPAAPTAPAITGTGAARQREASATKPLAADRLDTAPIAALRKALGASRWPERRQVNVRALANAAPPTAAPPPASSGSAAPATTAEVFTARVESSESPLHPGRRLVRVELRAREAAPVPRAPATVILLLDVSGSMDAPNRLPLVQEAAAALLRRLRPEDRVGVVTYAGDSRVLLPPEKLVDERAVRAAIDALEAKGRTNGGAGLREAFALAAADRGAAGEHVVILCTDGDFNMGETSEAELGALIDAQRDRGVRLAIFGFGRGERIDARLEALAARARGGSGYVNTRAEAEQALVSQLDALFAPVAEKLEATVEFDPARVARFRVVGDGEMRAVAPGAQVPLVARERVLPGEALTALLEVEPAAATSEATAASGPRAADLRVRATGVIAGAGASAAGRQTPYYGVWPARLDGGAFAEASVDFRFAAAMAAFGEALQAGPDASAAPLDGIARWARGAVGEDAGGYRAELVALLEQAQRTAAAPAR
ncbi:MAG: DUF3520 domain-containing protein [Opitutae bacterium]|nr:DUF3520 domain-containing protein [Opitutae bacterium]